jgi:hypothetical protein
MEPEGFPVFRWQNLVEIPETFIVSSGAGMGGTISPMGDSTVVAGESITFTITPNTGWVVNQVRINEIVCAGITTTYTFENVRGDSVIYVTFDSIIIPIIPPVLDTIQLAFGATIRPAFSPDVFIYDIDLPCGDLSGNFAFLFEAANSKDTIRIGTVYRPHYLLYEYRAEEGRVSLLEVRVINTIGEKVYRFTIRTPYDSVRIYRPFPNVLSVVNNPELFGGQEFKDNGSYQWFRDGSPIDGATGGVLYLGHRQTVGNHRYTVQVTHLDGTTNMVCPISWDVAVNSLEVFPNPTVGHITVKMTETVTSQSNVIEVFAICGKLMDVFTSTRDRAELDLTHLPAGVYIIRHNGQSAVVVRK